MMTITELVSDYEHQNVNDHDYYCLSKMFEIDGLISEWFNGFFKSVSTAQWQCSLIQVHFNIGLSKHYYINNK